MIIVFYQSDGSVEFRNRASMDVITADYNQDRVSTLPQAGFAFSTLEPSGYTSIVQCGRLLIIIPLQLFTLRYQQITA